MPLLQIAIPPFRTPAHDFHGLQSSLIITIMIALFVDADACPVKEETYRVARRHGLKVTLVSNSWMRIPSESWLELVVVAGDLDAADDWIVDRVSPGDIVVSADI